VGFFSLHSIELITNSFPGRPVLSFSLPPGGSRHAGHYLAITGLLVAMLAITGLAMVPGSLPPPCGGVLLAMTPSTRTRVTFLPGILIPRQIEGEKGID